MKYELSLNFIKKYFKGGLDNGHIIGIKFWNLEAKLEGGDWTKGGGHDNGFYGNLFFFIILNIFFKIKLLFNFSKQSLGFVCSIFSSLDIPEFIFYILYLN